MVFNLNWDSYPSNRVLITKNGTKWVTYPYHNKRLFKATPEELVRLQTIQFLVNEMKVPFLKETIEIEVQMSVFDKSNKGRADIVVYAEDEDGYLIPVLIVECKSNNIPLNEEVLKQVKKYDDSVSANTVMITNGKLLRIFSWHDQEKKYEEINKIPSYRQLAKRAKLKPIEGKGWQLSD